MNCRKINENNSKMVVSFQTFENFEFLKVLGKGTFGKVIMCREKATNQVNRISEKKFTFKFKNTFTSENS